VASHAKKGTTHTQDKLTDLAVILRINNLKMGQVEKYFLR